MAFISEQPIPASDLIALKAKVKAEMARRNQSGSLAGYASTSYDYSANPVLNQSIKVEHINKIVEPVRALNDISIPSMISPDDVLPNLSNVDLRISAYSTRGITDRSATDCKSGCTGTCYSGCATTCYTTCTGGCDGGCIGCGGSCGGQCSTNCSGGCKDGCRGGCSTSCGGCGSQAF